jgi:hypothetical protein
MKYMIWNTKNGLLEDNCCILEHLVVEKAKVSKNGGIMLNILLLVSGMHMG